MPDNACEFYPTQDEPICDCNSDVSGNFICTKEYSKSCQWANERREANERGKTNASYRKDFEKMEEGSA